MSIDRRDFLKLFGAALAVAVAPPIPVLMPRGTEPPPEPARRAPDALEGRSLCIRGLGPYDLGKYVYVSSDGELTTTYGGDNGMLVGMVIRVHDGLGDVRWLDPATVRVLTESA